MTDRTRLYSIDTLRALAMLLGILLHASIAYKAGRQFNLWIIDNYHSWFYDWLYLLINSFRMQLFFLLAGFFSALSIRKRSSWDFIKNRGRRLALPLLLAFFTILPLTLAPYNYFMYQQAGGDADAQLIEFLKKYFMLKERSGLMHLWFIYYLLLYTIGFAIIWATGLLKKIRFGSSVLIYSVILTILVALVAQGYDSEVPTIWTGFKILPTQFVYYGIFFMGGVYLEANREIIGNLEKVYVPFLIVGTLLSFVHTILINVGLEFTPMMSAAYKCTFAIETILLTFGLIGWFNAKFNKPVALSELMSGSAYWVYLIHLPLVMFFQLIMVDSWIPGPLKFFIVILLTSAVALSSYLLFVRGKWLGKFLDGK